MQARAVRKVYDQVERSPRTGLPVIWSEFNATYNNDVSVTDSPFMGPWLAKAAFNDFRLLHRLGGERLPNASDSAIVTRRDDGSIAIALWNYFDPEQSGSPRLFRLEFSGARPRLQVSIVDAQHGSALTAWRAMGSPAFPNRKQQEALRKAAELAPPEPFASNTITLPPHALALIETRP